MLGGIHDGDTLVVDRSLKPEHDRIVVINVRNNRLVKRLWIENGEMKFLSDNKAYEDIEMRDHEHIQIFGVVKHVIKKIL